MKLHQSVGMLEQLAGQFHTFSMETQDGQAKQLYSGFSKQLEQMVSDLKTRRASSRTSGRSSSWEFRCF